MVAAQYTKAFYELMRNGSTRSAEVILPLVLELVPARSVVDVGCGDGSWLAVLRRLGVDEILGIDGEYVRPETLQIPQNRFQAVDVSKPFALRRTFDLAISLEVGEHLPADSAEGFVESLTRLAPAVLFSAAIPLQGDNQHINEQWPDVWASLFRERDYVAVDCIRKRVCQNEGVEWWYAQNALLFTRADILESNPALKAEFEKTNLEQLCLVHPKQYLYSEEQRKAAVLRAEQLVAELVKPPSGVKEASKLFVAYVKRAINERVPWALKGTPTGLFERD